MTNYIVDTTLRDGEQAPGVIFNREQKLEIANLLNKLGIDEVEVGTPAMGDYEQQNIKAIVNGGFNFKTTSWCRALKSDIDLAATCKTDAISISFPVSEIQLKALNKKKSWILKEMPKLINYAKQKFNLVYIGLQDASRCSTKELKEYTKLAKAHGANRVRVADTVGIYTPATVMKLFIELSKEFPDFDFEFHAHNDLGMATANAFMALNFGAKGISTTINGLGERAGNAATEEVLMATELANSAKVNKIKKHHNRYNTSIINSLCSFVAEASRRPLHQSKPICGSSAFTHETGIHVKSLLNDKRSYQAFDESLVGVASNNIVIGKHSGKAALAHFFTSKGVNPTVQQLKVLQEKIAESISLRGKAPTESFIMSLYQNLQFSNLYYY